METMLNMAFYAGSIPGAQLELAPLFLLAALVVAIGLRCAVGPRSGHGEDQGTE